MTHEDSNFIAWGLTLKILSMTSITKISSRGLTLIEFFSVVVIVGFCAIICSTAWNNALEHLRISRVKNEIALIRHSLESYHSEFGTYPKTYQDFQNLVGTYTLKDMSADPWGNIYQYRQLDMTTEGEKNYDLYSLGPDLEDPSDDIHFTHN